VGKNKKKQPTTNLITIYVYDKEQLAQTQSMGGYFCSAYKKKKKLKLQIAFYPSQIHDTIILSFPLLLCCPSFFFFRIITLGGEQRKERKGRAHILRDTRFLCQQQNQLQTTQCWFAGEQREKTAESFLTSSCSSSGTSLPRGDCCQREEGS